MEKYLRKIVETKYFGSTEDYNLIKHLFVYFIFLALLQLVQVSNVYFIPAKILF